MQYTDWMAAAHDPVQAKGQAARQGRAGPPLLPRPHDRRHSVVPRRQYSPLQHPPLCPPSLVLSTLTQACRSLWHVFPRLQQPAVPVGDDQTQHLELARNIAMSFNSSYGDCFVVPNAMFREGAETRVMSLRNAANKMSKSDKSPMTRIDLTGAVETNPRAVAPPLPCPNMRMWFGRRC